MTDNVLSYSIASCQPRYTQEHWLLLANSCEPDSPDWAKCYTVVGYYDDQELAHQAAEILNEKLRKRNNDS